MVKLHWYYRIFLFTTRYIGTKIRTESLKIQKDRDKQCVQKLKPRFELGVFSLKVKYVVTAPHQHI